MSHPVPRNLLVDIPPNAQGEHIATLTWGDQTEDVFTPSRQEPRKTIISAISFRDGLSREHTTNSSTNQHTFADLGSGTLYRFVVCYEWGVGFAHECSNEVLKTTSGNPATIPGEAPPPTIPEATPLISQAFSNPSTLKTKASIVVRWNHRGSDGSLLGDIGELFNDFSWEWQERNATRNQDWSNIDTTETPSAEIKSVEHNATYEFRVRLRRKPFLAPTKFSEWAQISITSSPSDRSIRSFLRGESSINGLGKLLRQNGLDPKSLLKVLRT